MRSFVKQADPMESAASPIPQVQISTAPAPGKKGPAGMMPRQNSSRVNTGSPPIADAGAQAQKTAPPDGARMLPMKLAQSRSEDYMATMAGRPSVHDMIKAAMAGTVEKVNVSVEAAHQLKLAAEMCAKCEKEPCACSGEKKASATSEEDLSTPALDKLASALEYVAAEIDKGASVGVTTPGHGPGALSVLEAQASTPISTNSGQAKSSLVPSKTPSLQKVDGSATQMANDHDHAPGGSQKQQNAMVSQKGKHASAPLALIRKTAEDAINPAKISAAAASPPDTRAAGQPGGVPPAGGQTSMIASNEAARGYTKGQAKAEPKSDMRAYLSEPAHSAAHDHVLQNALTHTGQAGVKISEAKVASIKTAAARALLANLVDQVKPQAG